MLSNPGVVATIYTLGGIVFLGGFAIGAMTTLARVLYYFLHRIQRPRLLTRDVIVWGGLALSFAQIAIVRFLPPDIRNGLTAANVGWALSTTLPAVLAVCTYVYYELWVIERTREDADPLALEASVQTNIELTREGIVHAQVAGDKAEAAYHEANSVNAKIATLTEALGHKEDKPQ